MVHLNTIKRGNEYAQKHLKFSKGKKMNKIDDKEWANHETEKSIKNALLCIAGLACVLLFPDKRKPESQTKVSTEEAPSQILKVIPQEKQVQDKTMKSSETNAPITVTSVTRPNSYVKFELTRA